MIRITGPNSVNNGDEITLTCLYDLGRDSIYSIKWYKDAFEMYRYVPTDNPEFKIFGGNGLQLDVSIFLLVRVVTFLSLNLILILSLKSGQNGLLDKI